MVFSPPNPTCKGLGSMGVWLLTRAPAAPPSNPGLGFTHVQCTCSRALGRPLVRELRRSCFICQWGLCALRGSPGAALGRGTCVEVTGAQGPRRAALHLTRDQVNLLSPQCLTPAAPGLTAHQDGEPPLTPRAFPANRGSPLFPHPRAPPPGTAPQEPLPYYGSLPPPPLEPHPGSPSHPPTPATPGAPPTLRSPSLHPRSPSRTPEPPHYPGSPLIPTATR